MNSTVTTATIASSAKTSPLLLINGQNGITVIPRPTPLTRLNYFDGKFLRAADLSAEQRYVRSLVDLSNRAGGHGVAHGFDVTLGDAGQLNIGPGLAIDADGRVILLPTAATVNLQELIEKSRQATASGIATKPVGLAAGDGTFGECVVIEEAPPAVILESDLFVITIAQAEALCGTEDVYGKLCEEACVTGTDRPYRLEGVIVRARPLELTVPLPTSAAVVLNQTHFRSRVASAFFETERRRVASHISKAGLESEIWCLGAGADAGGEVAIAVVARAGAGVLFLDPWIVRRERIDPPARRYWQWRMAMRPWDVFLAQIFQFQCQLHCCLKHRSPDGGPDDPCKDEKKLLSDATDTIMQVTGFYEKVAEKLATLDAATLLPGGLSGLRAVQTRLLDARLSFTRPAQDRLLIRCGIIELPSAGYLPVTPSSTLSVNRQVRQWMGEGVDLRFCIVRPDYVAHALEEAQHMERISLTAGLDHPEARPQVDILVPNGEVLKQPRRSPGAGFEALVQFGVSRIDVANANNIAGAATAAIHLQGAARAARLEVGGGAIYIAAVTKTEMTDRLVNLVAGLAGIGKTSLTHLNKLRNLAKETDPAPVGSIASDPRLFSRLNTVAAEALRFNAARRATLGVFANEAPANPVAAEIFAPAAVGAERLAAFWAGASITQNPFTLAVGDSSPLELRLVLVMPAEKPVLYDLALRGSFRLSQSVPSAGGRTIAGVADCLISVTQNQGEDTPKPAQSSVRLKVTAFMNNAGTLLEVGLSDLRSVLELKFKSELSGDPLQVKSQVFYVLRREGNPLEVELANSLLLENPAVLETGNASHTAALSALETIEAALNDTGFADANARLLFPPPPPPIDDLSIRPVLDWVLFHRRRTRKCTAVTEPIVALTRKYQVYHLQAADKEQADAVRRALLSDEIEFLARAGFRPVDTVEFSPGIAALLTPEADIQADWKAAQPGPNLIYGAVASQGAAVDDGTALALARLAKLEQAVAPVSAPNAALINEPLPAVPAPLGAPGTDGVMVLMTVTPKVIKVCHDVRVATNSDNAVGRLREAAGTPDFPNLLELFSKSIGEVDFIAGETTPQGATLNQVIAEWKNRYTDPSPANVLFHAQGDAAQAYYQAQRKVIVGALKTTPGDVVPVAGTFPPGCPAITVLVPPPPPPEISGRIATVLTGVLTHVPAPFSAPEWGIRFVGDVLPGEKFSDPAADRLKQVLVQGRVVAVTLATRGDAAAPGAITRLKSIVEALKRIDRYDDATTQAKVLPFAELPPALANLANTPPAVDELVVIAQRAQ